MAQYEIVLADPPWAERGAGKIKRGADKHYPLMSTQDIKSVWDEVSGDVASDGFLFLWVTNNFLPDGLDVLAHWGYRYITNFAWVKNQQGLGFYARGKHELCLLGRRGSPARSKRGGGGSGGFEIPQSVLHADKGRHSAKPEAFYEIVESFKSSPESLCLEMFARDRHPGWDVWGNEIEQEGAWVI